MGKALYRKYRSRSLDEIVGQEHIVATLRSAVKGGKISHAYLLTGPRGTGKTSIARILAHEINSLTYSDEPHFDIIEIDAASNRRIDEIRDLRERVSTAPASAKYKVYIIDEVHMLTKEAFNALLKTLEEPPAHVVFILATTEAHKLPKTIVSRTQRYSFQPVALDKVVAHLKHIAEKEAITISDDALALIAEHGEGSFRDSISLLDQASTSAERVELAHIEQLLGRPPEQSIASLLEAITAHDPGAILQLLNGLYAQGFEAAMIAAQLSTHLRGRVLEMQADSSTFTLLHSLLAVPGANHPRHMLELCLLEASYGEPNLQVASAPQPSSLHSEPVAATQKSDEVKPTPVEKPIPSETTEEVVVTEKAPAPTSVAEQPTPATETEQPTPAAVVTPPTGSKPTRDFTAEALWQEVLGDIKQKYNTLYGIARMAKPRLEADTLHLEMKFAFHLKRINEARNHKILSDALTKRRGHETVIKALLSEKNESPSAMATPSAGDPGISNISNIFGGAELL
ncbi:MAG: DNA polymerase III subunit gamma/tau [Candidatus Saccharimonadales bacterium]